MDQQQKVFTFCEALGGEAVDQEFARQVLEAHDWDLQAAIGDILGDVPAMPGPPAAAAVPIPAATAAVGVGPPGAVHAAVPVPVPGGAAPARWRMPDDEELPPEDDDGYRAPMRTGYTDQLIGPGNPEEERRRAQEAEAERRRREEQAARQAEQRRLAEERARHEELARQVERQRKEAEQLARERKEAEPAKPAPPAPAHAQPAGSGAVASSSAAAPPGAGARQPQFAMDCGLGEDEDDDMDDWRGEREFLGGAFLGAGLDDDEEMDASAEAAAAEEKQRQQEQAEREKREAEERQRADAEVARQQQQSLQEQEALEREREEARQRELELAGGAASSSASKADPVVQACVALRKRYKDSDPAGLTSCMETVRAYVSNLVHNPLEQKFQRINCGNAAFQKKVAAFEGAVEILHACGFREDGDAALVVPADFVRSSGVKLRDALSKFDVMIEQLKSSA